MHPDFIAWPYPVLKPEAEWNDYDRDLLAFLRAAFAEGYQPRIQEGEGAIAADAPGGRSAFLVFRGSRNGWEPFFEESGRSVRLGPLYNLPLGDSACVCVRPPFRAAGHLAMEWLRGRPLESLLGDFVFVGGYPSGIELRPEVVSPSLIVK